MSKKENYEDPIEKEDEILITKYGLSRDEFSKIITKPLGQYTDRDREIISERSKLKIKAMTESFNDLLNNFSTIQDDVEKSKSILDKVLDLKPLENIVPGSVLKVSYEDWGFDYNHFGIYCGNYEVIHYYSKSPLGEKIISKTHIKEFLRDANEFYIVEIEDSFSNRASLENAEAYIGEGGYNLYSNNCEHFAMKCKTGTSKSFQVDDTLFALALIILPFI